MIIDYTHPAYRKRAVVDGTRRFLGEYRLSRDVGWKIIPKVKTDRNWITVNIGEACDHSIVFISDSIAPQSYEFLKRQQDMVLVCESPQSAKYWANTGFYVVYIPPFVDVKYTTYYRRQHGRGSRRVHKNRENLCLLPKHDMSKIFPGGYDTLPYLRHKDFLHEMARYKNVYARGRGAVEAKILDCNVITPDGSEPIILDINDARLLLEAELERIDG